MDKRFHTLSVPEQLLLRKQAVDDVLAHPEWPLAQAVRHLKKTMRLTTAEMAKLSGVSHRTMQDIEQERSEGSVQTMNRIFGMLGLKLTVARAARGSTPAAHQGRDRGPDISSATQASTSSPATTNE
ncbi:MAG: helix-turn-helix domain-containing protein [Rubrivivax sp.]|jgi:DNA-binding XRE family transcriptional regulator|nr:helix-turn-helix domain-containing protein [Rubrivivax sp.]